MSSFVRRLEIRLMKRAGYTRERWFIERGLDGKPKLVDCQCGGEITDPDDIPIGRHWPAAVSSRALPTKRASEPAAKPARGRRRGKRSKKWLAGGNFCLSPQNNSSPSPVITGAGA